MTEQHLVVAPGAVHLPGWLGRAEQRQLVEACRAWSDRAGGLRSPRLPRRGTMSAQIACLGWHWLPYRYSKTVEDGDGRPVPPFPSELTELSRRALSEAVGLEPSIADPGPRTGPVADWYQPDVALINWYRPDARMGMHADREERISAPVVSVSLGDSCVFRFGNDAGRGRPWTDVVLGSGDLFVFGGPSRLAYHGVVKILPEPGASDLGGGPGRFNLTIRQSGLDRPDRSVTDPGAGKTLA